MAEEVAVPTQEEGSAFVKLISRRRVFTSGAAVLAGTALPSGAAALDQQIASGPFMVAAKGGRNGKPWDTRMG